MIREHHNERDLEPTSAKDNPALEGAEVVKPSAQLAYLQGLGADKAVEGASSGAPKPKAKPQAKPQVKPKPKAKPAEDKGWFASAVGWLGQRVDDASAAASTGLSYAKEKGSALVDYGAQKLDELGEATAKTYEAAKVKGGQLYDGAKAKGAEALDWAGDRYDEAVSWTADRIEDGVALAKDAAEYGGEILDVTGSTDIDLDWKSQRLTAEGNIAEMSDLLPAGLLDGLEFDRSKADENRLKVVYDHKNDSVTITASSLSLSSMALGELTTGAATLTDLNITLRDTGEETSLLARDSQSLAMSLYIGGISVADVRYPSPEGMIFAEGMTLAGLSLNVTNEGGAIPFLDGVADKQLDGRFTLESAHLWGVTGAAEMADLSLTDLKASANQETGAATASLGALDLKGAAAQGNAVDHARIEGLNLTATQGRDGARDAVAVVAQTVALSGVNVPAVQQADAAAKKAEGDMATALTPLQGVDLGVDIGHLTGDDLKLSGVEVDGLDASGLRAHTQGNEGADLQLDTASVGRVASGGSVIEGARMNGLDLKGQIKGDAIEAQGQIGAMGLDRFSDGETTIKDAALTGLKGQVSAQPEGVRADLGFAAAQLGNLRNSNINMEGLKIGETQATATHTEAEGAHIQSNTARADLARLVAGTSTLTGVSVDNMGADLKLRDDAHNQGNVTLGGAAAQRINIDGVQLGATRLSDARVGWDKDAEKERVNAEIGGVHVEDLKVGEGAARAYTVQRGDTLSKIAAAQLGDAKRWRELADLNHLADPNQIRLGQTLNLGGGGGQSTIKSLDVAGLRGGFEREGDDKKLTGGLDALKATGLNGAGTRLDQLTLNGASGAAQLRDDQLLSAEGQLKALEAHQLTAPDGVTLERLKLEGLQGAARQRGENLTGEGSLKHIEAEGARRGADSLEFIEGEGLSGRFKRDGEGEVEALGEAKRLEAQGIHGQGVDVERARLLGLSGAATIGEQIKGSGKLTEGSIEGAEYADAQLKARLGKGVITGAYGRYDGERATGGLNGLDLRDIEAKARLEEGQAPTTDKRGEGHAPPATQTGGISIPDVVRSAMPLIQEANINTSTPMKSGDYQYADVEKNTRMQLALQVRDNHLITEGKELRFSVPLDGPLWITGQGVDIRAAKPSEAGGPQGRVIVELGGFFDPDISKCIYQAVDQDGKTIPLSLETWGNLIAQVMEKPAEAEAKAAERSRGKKEDKPTLDQSFLLAQTTGSADLKLGGGQINLGQGQSVQIIDRGGAKDNQISVSRPADRDAVAQVVNLLLGAININVGGNTLRGDAASLKGAQVSLDPSNPTAIDGDIKQITASKLRLD